jgi:Kef-type K+ transport system membrane component KefB
MGKIKNSFLYLIIIAVFGSLIWFVIQKGQTLESSKVVNQTSPEIKPAAAQQDAVTMFMAEFSHNLKHPLSTLILQIIAIIFFGKLFGFLFKKIGQPTVIGEIVAGIVLGPSIIGMMFPEFSAFVFPKESLKILQFLSQIGLIMFMFIIGMELNIKVLKNKAREAIVISHASIIFPYFLGVTLSYFMYERFAPSNISFTAFALFMGIAMSITAFPVLARIIQERGLTKSPLGAMAITCAAADDVTAWCILAAVIAIVKAGTITNALFTIGLSLAYVAVMLYIVRPMLKKLGSVYASKENLNKTAIAFMFIVLLVSAYLAEIIGIHALFGAFLAGVIIPENLNLKKKLIEKIEDVSIVLLLPLFFVLTGLRTQIGLLNEGNLWLVCGLIILVAVVGKFFGSAATAKFVGLSWHDSLSIGALMNTRGLMELIVLNIGYDLGILSPEVFAMMVLMALATTFMTGPSLDLINYFSKKKESVTDIGLVNPHKA